MHKKKEYFMTLLARYLIKNNAILLFLLCTVISLLYCIFNFIDNKSAMALAPSVWTIIKYYLLDFPRVITLLFSLLFFLSVVIQYTLMVKNKETLALLSCGVSLQQIITIFLLYSLFLVALSFIMTEVAIITERNAREIYRYEIRKRQKLPLSFSNIWFKKDDTIVHLGNIVIATGELRNITLYTYDQDKHDIQEQLTAPKGILQKDSITLLQVKDINFNTSHIIRQSSLTLPISIDIHAIEVAHTTLTELTLFDIIQAIPSLDEIGFDTTLLYSNIHSRLTNSVSLIIMGILALLIGINIVNPYIAIGISFLTALIFFLSRQLLETLVRLKILNPSFAPWMLLLLWSLACALIAYRTFRNR